MVLDDIICLNPEAKGLGEPWLISTWSQRLQKQDRFFFPISDEAGSLKVFLFDRALFLLWTLLVLEIFQ